MILYSLCDRHGSQGFITRGSTAPQEWCHSSAALTAQIGQPLLKPSSSSELAIVRQQGYLPRAPAGWHTAGLCSALSSCLPRGLQLHRAVVLALPWSVHCVSPLCHRGAPCRSCSCSHGSMPCSTILQAMQHLSAGCADPHSAWEGAALLCAISTVQMNGGGDKRVPTVQPPAMGITRCAG